MSRIERRWLIVGSIYCLLLILPGISVGVDGGASEDNSESSMLVCSEQFTQWLSNYYQKLDSSQVAEKINVAVQCNILDECMGQGGAADVSHTCPISYFLAKIFGKNPAQIFNWMRLINFTSIAQRKVVYDGLWFSNTAEGTQYLNNQMRTANGTEALLIKQVMQQPRYNVLNEKINIDAVEKLLMSFLATGEDQYIRRIVSVLSWDSPLNSPQIPTNEQRQMVNTIYFVKQFLRGYLQQNKTVFNICRNMLPSLDARAQLSLKQLLYDSDEVYQNKMSQELKLIKARIPDFAS